MADRPPRTELTRLINMMWVQQAVYSAAKLGVADALAAGPRSAADVARAVDGHPGAIHRLLRALVVLRVAAYTDEGHFALTGLGQYLTRDDPQSVQGWALLWGSQMMWEAWGRLSDCVKTGETAPSLMYGLDSAFELMERRYPEEAANFNRSMRELTGMVAPALAAAYDFSGVHRVVDVGGGFGQLLVPVLHANPELRGLVYDLPGCADGARKLMAEEGLDARCEFLAGDFFAAVPGGADLYLIKSVIHDWDDAHARRILVRIREAMEPGAKLVLLEWPIPERVGPQDAGIVSTDLNMLVVAGGLERTEAEYRALVASAGLQVTRILPTRAGLSAIEAVRHD
jgi:hypothetical protein